MQKRVLMLTGDFSEDYEVMVPYQALEMLGIKVDAVSPGKVPGQVIKTAIHDFEGDQTYVERLGHSFTINADFESINFRNYDGLYICGGRAPEYLRLNPKILEITKYFEKSGKPIASICHGAQILTAADIVRGKRLTAYPALEPEIKMAGGIFCNVKPHEAVEDGMLVTSPAWPGHPALLKLFLLKLF